jgi:drug/metabolite transporter (DMT)-like permease
MILDSEQSYRRRAFAALSLMVLIWGANFPIAKAALAELSPLAFNALRFPLAALVVYAALRRRGPLPWPDRLDRRRVLMLGVLGNALYQQFFIFGLDNSHAGIASVVLAGTPILTTLLSASAGHEHIRTRVWAGVLTGFVGIALVIAAGSAGVGNNSGGVLGNLVMLGACLAWAVYTVGSRDLVARYGPVPVTAWTLWSGTIVIVLIGLPSVLHTDLRAVAPAAWAGVGYAGVLSIGLAYLFWYEGVSRLGNARTSAFSNLVPIVALAASWAWLGERIVPLQLLGAAIVLAGLSLTQTRG